MEFGNRSSPGGNSGLNLGSTKPQHTANAAEPQMGSGFGGGESVKRSDLAPRYERGVLPFSNCLVTVPQDQLYAIERFGKFTHLAEPGLGFVGFDCCGCCINIRSMSSRTSESKAQVMTKTQGQMITFVNVTLQHEVDRNMVQEAMYKMGNLPQQIDSVVAHAVNTHWPQWTEKGLSYDIAQATEDQIRQGLEGFGIRVKKVIQSYTVPQEVAYAQEEKAKKTRERDATIQAAEADKYRMIKEAEAAAEAMALQGQGIARERSAIVEGMRESINHATGEEITPDKITELLFITQHFETLKVIGSGPHCKAVFLPEKDGQVNAPTAEVMRS